MLSLNDIIKRTFVQGKLGASTIATCEYQKVNWVAVKGSKLSHDTKEHPYLLYVTFMLT